MHSRRLLLIALVLCAGLYAGVAGQPRAAAPDRRLALVQGQHPHAHAQQRRRQHARRGRALVSRARLPLPGPHRSQLPDRRRRRSTRSTARTSKFLVIKGEEVTSRSATSPSTSTASTCRRVVSAAGRHVVVDVLQQNVDAHPRGQRRAAHQPPELRLGDHGRRTGAGPQQPAVRDLQRPSAGEQRRRRRRARASKQVWDLHPVERASSSTASRSTMRTRSSSRATRASSRPGRGWVCVRAPRLDARAIAGRARTRRLLRVHRRGAGGLPGGRRHRSSIKVQADDVGRVPRPVHRQGRDGARGGPGDRRPPTPHRHRRLRPRQGASSRTATSRGRSP